MTREALKFVGALLFICLVAVWVALVAGCGENGKATFTPVVIAPDTVSDAQVMADAEDWAKRAPDRYWATTADTHSMEPYYTAKSVPLLVRYTGQSVVNGTVAVFNRGDPNGRRAMHVISDQTATHVYMSGVNNHQSDGWFHRDRIEGIVVGQFYRP